MNNHITRTPSRSTSRVLAGAAAVLALMAPLGIGLAATKKTPVAPRVGAGYIPVNGKRVVLILPVQTTESWTANPVFTRNLKQRASTVLRDALLNTGQFSLIEVNRFNPVLQRGVIDDLYSQEDFDAVIADPTPEGARNLLSKLTFDRAPKLQFSQPPLIAQVTLDTYPTKPGSATVQVTGNLYEMGENENTIFRTKSVIAPLTIRPVMPMATTRSRRNRNNQSAPAVYRTSDLLLGALTSAFSQIASDFARPLREAEAPFVAAPVGPTLPDATPVAPPAPVNPNATPQPIPTEVAPEAPVAGTPANTDPVPQTP